ncbi:MAG: hypothetical protein NZ908_02725 [Candidatus Micrarchaeota archaeon]|nr:hypothetical protein [Candidatus Micrarchaeota archaeon]MCX8154622.1 hypothetical protein [Candidatus Micrarchaeota archaeon]
MGRKPMFRKNYSLNDTKAQEILMKFSGNYVDALGDLQRLVEQYEEEKNVISRDELLTIQQAYEYLKQNGVNWEYNVFRSRVDRKSIESVLGDDGYRYIQRSVLDRIIQFEQEVYTLEQAYNMLKRVNPKLTMRAFIGRIEKDKIPVIVAYRKRYIPKRVVDDLVYIYSNYVEVAEALAIYRDNGINISRNTLERRLDRGILPYITLGKKRLIPKAILFESINDEKELKLKI